MNAQFKSREVHDGAVARGSRRGPAQSHNRNGSTLHILQDGAPVATVRFPSRCAAIAAAGEALRAIGATIAEDPQSGCSPRQHAGTTPRPLRGPSIHLPDPRREDPVLRSSSRGSIRTAARPAPKGSR